MHIALWPKLACREGRVDAKGLLRQLPQILEVLLSASFTRQSIQMTRSRYMSKFGCCFNLRIRNLLVSSSFLHPWSCLSPHHLITCNFQSWNCPNVAIQLTSLLDHMSASILCPSWTENNKSQTPCEVVQEVDNACICTCKPLQWFHLLCF